MVRRGLVGSRGEAARAIEANAVLVNGAMADKSSRLVDPADAVVLQHRPRFVSRGGEKLDAALDAFAIDVAGMRALDAGASTGGFTDCLLQRGAAHVVALDVGHGQLHPKIRADPRVSVFERFHIRDVTADVIGGEVDLAVADLSFISLVRVLSPLIAVAGQPGELALLVKPQFEAARPWCDGYAYVIRDAPFPERACDEVSAAFVD